MDRLKGKVVIITGAASGQGASEARVFANEGAKVIVTDISEEGVQRTASEIIQNGGEALPLVHDVSSEQDWQRVIRHTIEQFGCIHVLVNNAGVASRATIEEESFEDWEKVQRINSSGVFLGLKYSAPEIRKAGGGSIINISSVYAMIGGKYAAYNASKGAIRSLTKTAALEYAKDRIRVNSIHPGIIETSMTVDLYSDPTILEWLHNVTPWPDLGKPEDVAYGALYLASDESRFVTGAELVIDGGWIAH
jgi:cyclopentanol dehydrogenase